MPYDGYLDTNDGWSAFGWAIRGDRPHEPVEVEFKTSAGHTGSVRADQFRADLKAAGVGDGRHAFAIPFPDESSAPGGEELTAWIKGTNFMLKGSPMRRGPRQSVGLVAGDIVNNCNLRCPFCMVDYANIRGLKLMTPETYARALELLPGMPRGNFWLSCLHEPTLHPQFINFVEAVPTAYRDRISVTTNLSKRLPDDVLERLAHSGVDHLRISYDSRDPAVFAALRKGARLEIFEDNLRRLRRFMAAGARRLPIHFITVALKENQREIPYLIRYCHDELGARSHEVRYPYYMPHFGEWGREHVLAAKEWDALDQALAPLAAFTQLTVSGPLPGMVDRFEHHVDSPGYVAPEAAFGGPDDAMGSEPPDPESAAASLTDEPLQLRLRWDGLMDVVIGDFRVNINRVARPNAYFEAVRLATKRRAGRVVSRVAT